MTGLNCIRKKKYPFCIKLSSSLQIKSQSIIINHYSLAAPEIVFASTATSTSLSLPSNVLKIGLKIIRGDLPCTGAKGIFRPGATWMLTECVFIGKESDGIHFEKTNLLKRLRSELLIWIHYNVCMPCMEQAKCGQRFGYLS